LRMPGMSGLDLLSHLAASGSRNPVIVMTGHSDPQARERCLRAGAVAFLEKPFQATELLDAVRSALSSVLSAQLDGSTLGGRHVCAFFNTLDEQHRVLRPFFRGGFDRGEKALHIVDPELRDEHLKRLGEAGIDVEGAIASGQLDLRSWHDAY